MIAKKFSFKVYYCFLKLYHVKSNEEASDKLLNSKLIVSINNEIINIEKKPLMIYYL